MNRNITTVGAIGMTGFLLAGCATSLGSRAKESDALKQQVASLEGQVGTLTQRVDEVSQRQESIEAHAQGRPVQSKTAKAISNREIQIALKSTGFYQGSIDGKLGPQTKEAIVAFQKSKGLTADGKVGTKTAAALAKALPANSSGE